jgi:probable HAF family extracellular repeat protein
MKHLFTTAAGGSTWCRLALLALCLLPLTAAAYPKVKYVRLTIRTEDRTDAGASGFRLDTGGFKNSVTGYRNGYKNDTVFADGWIAASQPSNVGIGEHNMGDGYIGRPWTVDTWLRLDPPLPYATAVKALRTAGFYNTANSDRWDSSWFSAKFIMFDGSTPATTPYEETGEVNHGYGWMDKEVRLRCSPLADKLMGRYNSPMEIFYDDALVANTGPVDFTMTWNTTGTARMIASDPDAVVTATVVSSDNEALIPKNNVTFQVNDTNVAINLKSADQKFGDAKVVLKFTESAESRNVHLKVKVSQVMLPAVTNEPPKPAVFPTLTLTGTSDGRIRVGTSRTLGATVSNPTGGAISLSASSANSAVFPASGITFSGTDSNRTMTVSATGATPGTSLITVRAQNSDGNSTNQTFTVDVRADKDHDSQPQWSGSTTALSFNGRDDVVELPKSVWASGDVTMEGWVYLRQHKPWAGLLEVGNGPVGNRLALILSYNDNTGRAALIGNDGGATMTCVAARGLTLNRWTHVAATIEKGRARIYYDGELVGDGSVSLPSPVERVVNTIGKSSFDPAGFVDGIIDEVRLWNVARTEDELRKARFPASPATSLTSSAYLVGYWPLNDGTGNTVSQSAGTHGLRSSTGTGQALYPKWTVGVPNALDFRIQEDSSGQSVTLGLRNGSGTWSVQDAPRFGGLSAPNGSLAGSVTYTPWPDFNSGAGDVLPDGFTVLGLVSSTTLAPQRVNMVVLPVNDLPTADTRVCLALNGGSVEIAGSAAALSRPQNQEFSLEAWITPTTSGGPIVSKRGEYYFGLGTNNCLRFYRADRSDRALMTETSVVLSAWSHVAATFDGSMRRLFLNGALVAEESGSGEETVLVTQRGHNVKLGATDLPAESLKLFRGSIDELRIWNRALAPDQIFAQMNRTLRGDGSGDELGLLAYYRFDEGQGVIAYDSIKPVPSGPPPLDASISGSTAWATRAGDMLTQLVDEDALTELALSASDVDRNPGRATGARDKLEFVITAMPLHGSLTLKDPAAGLASYLPSKDYTGPDSFTYTVRDQSGSQSANRTVDLHVVNINDPPVIEPLPNLVLPEGESLVRVPVLLSDVDGPTNPSVTGIRLDPRTILQTTNVVLTTNSEGGLEIQITPPTATYGTVRISVSATDGEATTLASFTVSLIPSLVYHIIDLGDLAQEAVTEAVTVDELGRAGGWSGSGTAEKGLLFGNLLSGGSLLDTGLSSMSHRITGLAVGISGSPTYEVGYYRSAGKRHAYRRIDGVVTNFNWTYGSEATAVNRFGTVVGVATNFNGLPYPFYLPSSIQKLATTPWLITAFPRGIPVGLDAQENIVGYFRTNSADLGWIYRTYDSNTVFMPPPSGFSASRPSAIAEDGTVVSGDLVRQTDGRSQAALYLRSSGSWRLVSTNWLASRAYGVNNSRQLVGEATSSSGVTNAFLAFNSKIYDLNDLLAPDSPWKLERALAINNQGQIAGVGVRRFADGSSERRAFLAVPGNVIGLPVPRPLGAVAMPPTIDLLQSRPNDTPQQSFIWGEREKTLYAVRPVTARINWRTTTDMTATNARMLTVFAANLWPQQPQVHAAGAPVLVAPEKAPWPYSFFQQAYSDVPGAELDQQVKKFTTPTNSIGYTVWHYLRTDGLPTDPNTQTNFFTVVRTYTVPQLLSNKTDIAWPIGDAIFDPDHQEFSGRNGYVFYEKSAYDAVGPNAAYNRTERRGAILPVNKLNRRLSVVNGQNWNDQDLVVVWYALNNVGVAWAERPVRYEPYWPTNAPHLVIASTLGTSPYGPISSALAPQAHLYDQADGTLPGFNPNEEHAMLIGETAYALRCDLNSLVRGYDFSEPYVLVKFRNRTTQEWNCWVFKVVAEEHPYYFNYPGTAGNEVQPPLPLSVLPLYSGNVIASGKDIAIKDYKGKIYARAAGVRGGLNTNLVLRYWYPMQPDFYWHTAYGAYTTWMPWLDRLTNGVTGTPVPVRYEIRWPDEAPVLSVGETLFRSKHGLPSVLDMANVRLIFDSANPALTDDSNANNFRIGQGFMTQAPTNLARLFDPLSERYVKLGATFVMPSSLRLWDADQGRKIFADLPYHLRLRLSYDPLNKWLYFKGYMDETGIGEPLVLLNVMSADELARIQDLDEKNNSSAFDTAVENLYWMTRNPNQLDLDKNGLADKALLVGLQYRVLSTAFTNGVWASQYDTNYLDYEALPAGPKALTAAISNNEAAPPSPGQALSLNNLVSDYLVVTNMPAESQDRLTWEAWVKRRGVNSEDIVLSWGQTSDRLQAGFRSDGYFYFQVGGVTLVSDEKHLDLNEWHHWAGVYDSLAMAMYLYRDGEIVGQADLPEAVPWAPAGELRLGSGVARDPRAGFYGYLDEVRVWTNTVRAYSEIAGWRYQTLFAKTPGLAGYWQMDEAASPVRDTSGYQRVARAVGSDVAWTSAAGQGWGIPPRFISLMENNDSRLGGLPVSVKIIQIGPGPFAGDMKVIYPDNVFDERLTLRVSSDFAAAPELFDFEWYYKSDAPNFRKRELPLVDATSGAIADAQGWIPFNSGFGLGKNTITIGEGGESGLLTLSDNWFICRYRGYNVGTNKNVWSPWIGDPSSKSEPWPMLAEGWVKRVIRGLNPFDERVSDLSQSAASTKTSMLQQAGPRYEGDIAFNPSPENLNRIGLIEAYETVLRRARSLSTDGTPPVNFQPANNALLLVASRIADLYSLLGNEAYADAVDPTIGFRTDDPGVSTYGNTASSMFAFLNQVDSLLEEELSLLRGRDNSGAGVQGAPLYNRLFWNFTLGDGEVAYVNAYNLSDQNADGRINETDARVLYPQGHGDAWGHYLTATKTYYDLLRNPNFTWVPRSENVVVAGVPVKVDYLDERKFALAAAAKAKAGVDIVDLTYRRNYVEDPDGQWQGYTDTDPERGWGVDDWAKRTAHGAMFDWLTLNAVLPAVDPDPSHTGLDRIDRGTVLEIKEIATHMEDILQKLDSSDSGLNPLGLAKGVVPFDIDPSFLVIGSGVQGRTHFEQIYLRAQDALNNALRVFNEVNGMSRSIRAGEDATQAFARETAEQERDFKNRLIETFGYPYPGEIGPGKLYPSGYDGPDLTHYMYVDTSEINPGQADASAQLEGFFNSLSINDTNAGLTLDASVNQLREDLGSSYGDSYKHVAGANYPLSAGTYLFEAPADWGQRRAPGELQAILSDLVQADARLKQAVKNYDALIYEIKHTLNLMDGEYQSFAAAELSVLNKSKANKTSVTKKLADMESARIAMDRVSTAIMEITGAAEEGIPKIVGLASDTTSGIRMAIGIGGLVAKFGSDLTSDGLGIAMAQTAAQQEIDGINVEVTLKGMEVNYELQQKMKEGLTQLRQEPALRLEMHTQKEVVEQTFGRFRTALANGQRIIEERNAFRRKTAGDATKVRYQDMAFRIFRNEAIQKYRASFDLSARYVYLTAAAYDYESNLIGNDGRAGRRFFTDIVRQRALGAISEGVPVASQSGLANPLARMAANFAVMKTQMGFNNPQFEAGRFSLRRELFRIKGEDADSDDLWREQLKRCRVEDLWQVPEFKRYCRPMAPQSLGAQPALVIRFPSSVTFGLNYFGWPLSGGDSAYDPSQYATKIAAAGIWFTGYDGNGMSMTPRVYLVPVGADVLRSPNGDNFELRMWRVIDQKIPLPYPISEADIRNPTFIPVMDSLSGSFVEIRKFSALRAYHDGGEFDPSEAVTDSRLIGRSVWNTEWMLVIPGGTLLSDPDAGLEAFAASVSDIKLLFQTYAYSGN